MTDLLADDDRLTLVDLIADTDVSVRLANAIMVAATNDELPYETLADYLGAGPDAPLVMQTRVRNLGRKSADELHELALAEGARLVRNADAPPPPPDIREFFRGHKLSQIREGALVSVRLGKLLDLEYFGSRDMADALQDFPGLMREMRRTPNCGRKSTNEFAILCARYVTRLLPAGEGETSQRRDALIVALLSGQATDEAAPIVLDEPDIPAHESLAARLDWLLAELPERLSDILHRRYGLNGQPDETLEEVGQDYDVTRERIRQLEAGALRRLRTRITRAPIHHLLTETAAAQWAKLSVGDDWVTFKSLPDCRKRLDGHVLLAIKLMGLTLSGWLDRVAGRLTHGWCESAADVEAIRDAARAAKAALETLSIPRLAGDLAPAIEPRLLRAAWVLELGARLHLDYAVGDRVGPRLKRVIGLHTLLGRAPLGLEDQVLLAQYHRSYPDDVCNVRDAEIVMQAAPHLFIQIIDGRWAALGEPGVPPTPGAAPTVRLQSSEESGTIGHALEQALAQRGLSRIGDLIQDADLILPENRSVNSIGPVLLTRSDRFGRALPGVYGLIEQIPAPDDPLLGDLSCLLNEDQARLFALGRYAGEPRTAYPLWSMQAEERLCRWARHGAAPEVFNALLAVARPERWPNVHDLDEWRDLKHRFGRFGLGFALRKERAYGRPDLDRVLAGAVLAEAEEGLSWISANRILGHRVESYAGAGLLAVLALLGAVRTPLGDGFAWQRRHMPGPRLVEIRELLSGELSQKGQLDWKGPTGLRLSTELLDLAPSSEDWIDRDAVRLMMATNALERSPVEDDPDEDPLARLMRERRKEAAAEAHEKTLKWLLES